MFSLDIPAVNIEVTSSLNAKGRGMELSDLCLWNGSLYTCDDKTGTDATHWYLVALSVCVSLLQCDSRCLRGAVAVVVAVTGGVSGVLCVSALISLCVASILPPPSGPSPLN